MTIKERVNLCRLIEKIDRNRNYSKSIGINNVSRFKGKKVNQTEIVRK